MIAYLKGNILSVSGESLVLDVSGVGYEVQCSTHTLQRVSLGDMCEFFAYTHVREDALQIFGFENQSEKELFLSLLKVNGVGPKLAIKILSSTTVENFLEWVESSDIAALSKLPKVGKKTAEQLVLTLKGKLNISDAGASSQKKLPGSMEIVSALVNLGFKESECQRVVQELPAGVSFEEGVRQGLSSLANLVG